jgi:hypothetical protein
VKLQPRQQKGNSDLSAASRFLWTRLAYHSLNVNTPASQIGKGHSRVIFSLTRGQGQPVVIDLTALTAVELEAFKQSVLIATEVAAPICAELDHRAQEEMENGDDSNPRCYRPLPSVVIRPRAFREYRGSILDGRKDVLSGMQLNVLSASGLSDDSSDLDEQREEQPSGSKDNP